MCGIAGFWGGPWGAEAPARAELKRMTDAIAHRGPDADGGWLDGEAGIALGHRRLSIIDLTEAGAQPMLSASGRFVLVYNGEIYNHLDLRQTLETEGAAPAWRGHSDTETLLAAIERWGVAGALNRATGMFALALWDRAERSLTLARDRMGEKPLYYGWTPAGLLFGSEIKALAATPRFPKDLDAQAVAAFLRYGYVPEPRAIFSALRKLPAGTMATFASAEARPEPVPYWSLVKVVTAGRADPLTGDDGQLQDALEACLLEVVRSQMLSDVPLGCFLSGGIDSSLVAAMMQRAGDAPARTYSIGFELERFDEAAHARQVADHLQTEHTEFILTEPDALAVIPELARIYDEPFADSSQIPTAILSRLARQQVTVALTGDGGDEVFGGYNRHIHVPRAWRVLGRVPGPGRRALGRAVGALDRFGADANSRLHGVGRRLGLPLTTFERAARLGEAIAEADTLENFYRGITSTFACPGDVLLAADRGPSPPAVPDLPVSPAERLMLADALTYLPGDILVKVDRASMSTSLETRAPYLDRRIVEFSWRLPLEARIAGRTGKRILRELLYRYVPRELIERPKQGFAIPLDQWLRGQLRPWAEELLTPDRLRRHGVLDAEAVRALWAAHLAEQRNAGEKLWNILMLQGWLEDQFP